MDQLPHVAAIIALTMGLAWTSGINPCASVPMPAFMGTTEHASTSGPENPGHPTVLLAAGFQYAVDFVGGVGRRSPAT